MISIEPEKNHQMQFSEEDFTSRHGIESMYFKLWSQKFSVKGTADILPK